MHFFRFRYVPARGAGDVIRLLLAFDYKDAVVERVETPGFLSSTADATLYPISSTGAIIPTLEVFVLEGDATPEMLPSPNTHPNMVLQHEHAIVRYLGRYMGMAGQSDIELAQVSLVVRHGLFSFEFF